MNGGQVSLEPKAIYKDKNFLVLNKPAGILTHGTARSGAEPTVAGWLLKKYPEVAGVGDNPKERPGIVHRLDKDTSGVMVAALNQEYFLYLKLLFQERKIKKTYLALVFGEFKDKKGIISKPIGIKPGTTKRTTFSEKMKKGAVTEYKVKERLGFRDSFFSLLEASPKTGRTHQIRVHLAAIGHPVAGDGLYGKMKRGNEFEFPRLMLHALSIEFSSRKGEKLKFEAGLPGDFSRVIRKMKKAGY